MFRAELKQLANGPILKMEGRLVGDWANEARSLVTRGSALEGLVVDLTEVSYVDGIGEQLLVWLSSIGARFVATAVYAAGICERLELRPYDRGILDKKRYQGLVLAKDGMH